MLLPWLNLLLKDSENILIVKYKSKCVSEQEVLLYDPNFMKINPKLIQESVC